MSRVQCAVSAASRLAMSTLLRRAVAVHVAWRRHDRLSSVVRSNDSPLCLVKNTGVVSDLFASQARRLAAGVSKGALKTQDVKMQDTKMQYIVTGQVLHYGLPYGIEQAIIFLPMWFLSSSFFFSLA